MKIAMTAKGLKEAVQDLRDVGRKVETVNWYAMVNTAEKVRDRLIAMVVATFDRPTPLIVNGLRVVQSRKTSEVAVGWKDTMGKGTIEHNGRLLEGAAALAMVPQIQGGGRSPKGMERQMRNAGILGTNEWIVPSRTAPLDQYGNIPRSVASKILADLWAYRAAGGARNTGSGKGKGQIQYMVGQVGSTRGIFKIEGGAKRAGTGRWHLVFIITKRAPRYRKLFDFYGIGQAEADRVFSAEWARVFERELAKGRAAQAQP